MADKPYPWTCGNCATKSVFPVVKDYSTKLKYENVVHDLFVPNAPIPTCMHCSTEWMGLEQSDLAIGALRQKVALLFPQAIKEQRLKLNLSEKELAEIVNLNESDIFKIESGVRIQSTQSDQLLREALQLI